MVAPDRRHDAFAPSARQRSRASTPRLAATGPSTIAWTSWYGPYALPVGVVRRRLLELDARSCPSDGPSDRCRRRTPAGRPRRRSSGGVRRRWDGGRRSRSGRVAAFASRAAIATTDRARACRAGRNPRSGCSSEGADASGDECEQLVEPGRLVGRSMPGSRSTAARMSQPRMNTVCRAASSACRTRRK